MSIDPPKADRIKEFFLFYFSDRINQASLKSFALAGGIDRIEKYESKINPDNPARPGIA